MGLLYKNWIAWMSDGGKPLLPPIASLLADAPTHPNGTTSQRSPSVLMLRMPQLQLPPNWGGLVSPVFWVLHQHQVVDNLKQSWAHRVAAVWGGTQAWLPVTPLVGMIRGGGDLAGAKFRTAKSGTAKLYHILPWHLRTEATFLPLPNLCTFSLHYKVPRV